LAIVGWLIFLTFNYRRLLKKGGIIFEGNDPAKLEEIIKKYFESIKTVDQNNQKIEKVLKKTKKLAESSINKVALLRYNPFGDVGSDQSFSLCLLNSSDDGFVLSSIHSREGTRVYSKPIKSGNSTYNLSKEEQKVINIATKKGE